MRVRILKGGVSEMLTLKRQPTLFSQAGRQPFTKIPLTW